MINPRPDITRLPMDTISAMFERMSLSISSRAANVPAATSGLHQMCCLSMRSEDRPVTACVKDSRFHDLRHSAPTLLAREGASEQQLKAIGGC